MASGDFLDLAEHAMRSAQMADVSGTSYDAGDLAAAKQKVNEAYLSCLDSGDPWTFLKKEGQWSTTASADKYSYSSVATAIGITGAEVRRIDALTIDTQGFGRALKETTWLHLEQMSAATQESGEGVGTPYYWCWWGNQNAPNFRFYPSPDAAYLIGTFLTLQPTELSASGDTPIMPLAWRHRIIVPYAAALLLEQEGGNEAGAQYERLMRRYDDSMTKFRTAYASASAHSFNITQPGLMERELGSHSGNWNDW